MKHENILAWATVFVAFALPVRACDLCSVYSAQEAQGGGQGIYAGLAEQYTDFGTFKVDGQTAANPDHEYIHSLSSQVFAGYNFNQRFGVQFNLPVIWREYGQVAARGSESGLGDASLIGHVRLFETTADESDFIWTALGGIKFPTGDPSWLGKPDFAAGIGGHDLALGSGSYDGLVGTGFSARWKRVFLSGQMQYGIRTEGSFQHQYANDWTWAGGPGVYLALKDDYSLALQAAVSGETKGKDTFGAVPDGDSAETVVYVGPQVDFTWTENCSAHVGADLPVSYANSGEQILPSYRLHAAVTWRF